MLGPPARSQVFVELARVVYCGQQTALHSAELCCTAQPDYEQQMMDESRFRAQLEQRNKQSKKAEKKHDDPYYCGLRARIPNFAKSKAQKEKESK